MDQLTHNLGGTVATHLVSSLICRAPDDDIVAAIQRAARLNVITPTDVGQWVDKNVSRTGWIRTVAQEVIELEDFSDGLLRNMQNRGNIGDGVSKKKGPMPVDVQKKEWMATAVPARSSPWFMDSDKACEILESLLAQQDEILSLQKENRLFIKYKKVQEEWKQHRIESLQLEQRTEYLRRKHAQQKTRQKHDNQTGPLQQRVDQEISDEQKMDLQLLEKQKTEHAKKGKEIKHRGHLSQCEVYILPERDVVEPKVSPQHNKIFLSAFLRRVREIQRDQEEVRKERLSTLCLFFIFHRQSVCV